MSLLEVLRVAIRALRRNKMRSFLTTLGIMIGVAAVIAMVAIGDGANAQIDQAMAAMGSNMLIVLPGSTTAGGVQGGFGSMPTVTWDDVRAMRSDVPAVKYVSPALRATAQVVGDEQNWTTSVNGISPEYFQIREWRTIQGALFSVSDIDAGTKVVVLGKTVADKVFGPGVDPTGQTVRIKNIPFDVAGVLAAKGQSPMGQDYDDAVFVPYTTFLAKVQGGLKNYVQGAVLVGADSFDGTVRAETQIRALLRDRHRLADGADDDFSIRNLTEMASARADMTRNMTLLLAAIALVSLIVGGIGIMNIMLVSVTERTREIGTRMAVGARGRDILLQFVVEAISLSAIGGIIGVTLGLGAAAKIASAFGWPVLFRPDIIVVAVVFSGAVGVIFGLYPAWKASRLDPIQALRFE